MTTPAAPVQEPASKKKSPMEDLTAHLHTSIALDRAALRKELRYPVVFLCFAAPALILNLTLNYDLFTRSHGVVLATCLVNSVLFGACTYCVSICWTAISLHRKKVATSMAVLRLLGQTEAKVLAVDKSDPDAKAAIAAFEAYGRSGGTHLQMQVKGPEQPKCDDPDCPCQK